MKTIMSCIAVLAGAMGIAAGAAAGNSSLAPLTRYIDGFDQSDVLNSSSIGSFEFDDGTSLSTAELLARGFDINGTAGTNTLVGTNTTDRISVFGGATNDARFEGERRAA